ncbi:hypothetical protein VPH35_043897 [Triticum aestivum]
MATADDLKKLEEELKNRESIIRTREDELQRQAEERGKAVVLPAASTYAASIKTFVPITLDLHDSNYAKWRELFLVALGRYGLSNHVLSENTPTDTSHTSDWGRDDFTVLSWIYGSISLELFGVIMKPGSTAKQVWDAIANLFRDNKKSRALALDAEFRNTTQGDMTISAYCAKLKTLSDALDDVEQPVTDETLVLTLLRGLNEQYSHLRSFLPFQVPFPSFLQTRSALVLEEAQKKTDAKNSASTALWASGNSVLPGAGGERTPPPNDGRSFSTDRRGPAPLPSPGGRGGSNSGRGRGRGGRGRRDTPWMYNPWTGQPTRLHQQQMPSPHYHQPPASSPTWSPRPWRPTAPGVLGPRPTTPSPQAYATYGHGPAAPYNPPAHYNNFQQHVDPALLTALNNMQLPGNQEWFMDSGASSHMASDPGTSYSDRDTSMQ